MKRTTISLPEELAERVEREAQRRGTSVSDVARQALVDALGPEDDSPREVPFANLGASGQRHVGRDHEEILRREWGAAGDR